MASWFSLKEKGNFNHKMRGFTLKSVKLNTKESNNARLPREKLIRTLKAF